jgi:hypothetical protein
MNFEDRRESHRKYFKDLVSCFIKTYQYRIDVQCLTFLGGSFHHHHHYHHHQPINAPTAGAQTFLMDYPQGEGVITYHADPVWIGGC